MSHPAFGIQRGLRAIRSICAVVVTAAVALAARSEAGDPALPAAVDLPWKSYFLVTGTDPRLCPSPVCGGVYVKQVNRRLTRCADGSLAEACYAPILDWSSLGLDLEQEWQLEADFRNRRVLARGELRSLSTPFGELPGLVVSDAWRGATGNEPHGRFLGLVPSGIVCITWPCPELLSLHLNRDYRRLLHGIDLGASGADDAQIAAGLRSLFEGPGLLAVGKLREIHGPAGEGLVLAAREFYLKVASRSGAAVCGGPASAPAPGCAPGEFCDPPAGSCGVPDPVGTCTPIGDACPLVFDPVCGCDRVTYGNDCERLRAQVGLDHAGACASP